MVLLVTAVLFIGALLTTTILSSIVSKQKEKSDILFSNRADTAAYQLNNAIEKYSTLVVATQALFHASKDVSRKEFQLFSDSFDIEKLFPYTQAISWNLALDTKSTAIFEQSVQNDFSTSAEGFPEFTVRPETDQATRYVVTYIEPMKGNGGAFGFDIGSNKDRRATVELARDTGRVVATAPVTLAQEQGDQKGFLMMLPVFGKGANGEVIRDASTFQGVVVAVFRMGDLISTSSDLSFASVQVFDVTDAKREEQSEAFFSQNADQPITDEPTLIRTVNVANRQWEMLFERPQITSVDKFGNRAFATLGALITVLAAIFIGYIVTSRQRVFRQATLLTADLQKSNNELERSNEDLAQFAFVASHDLQTPVRNIRMSVELLEQEIKNTNLSSDVAEYMNILRTSSDRMRELIRDLLDYAHSGNNELQKIEIHLNTLFSDVERDTLELLEENKASLIIGNMPAIHANKQQLERVFVNLIENAVKYSHSERPLIIEINSSQSASTLSIRIKDNGIGIEEKFHDSIFTAFRRLHRQNEIRGSGLGLSICRKILQQHKGSIHVDSSNDEGTVFLITLPIS